MMIFGTGKTVETMLRICVAFAILIMASCSHTGPEVNSLPAASSSSSTSTPPSSSRSAPETAAEKAKRDEILKQESIYSQDTEELIVRHFFNDRRGGIFVDVGCYHWFNYSVTAYLELKLGWDGLAIDALPFFSKGWEKNRPKSKFLQYAVTDKSGEEMSFYAAGPLSSLNETHVDQWASKEKKIVPKEIKVQTITLNDLLEANGIDKIDFMNMDIEGGEPNALKGFDIKRYKPELVCVEAAGNVRQSLIDYFGAHDYVRIDEYLEIDTVNWYYRPNF